MSFFNIFKKSTSATMSTIKHEVNVPFKKATFGMGCFWGCDSVYGVHPGVLRTRVGYAGGATANPTYRSIGDHTEVIEIDFDPSKVTYQNLLQTFWNHHEYGLDAKVKRQYMSLILYHDEEQKKEAEESKAKESEKRKQNLVTVIQKAETFYPAEDYHQKYRLQGHKTLAKAVIGNNLSLLQTSYAAARLNGYVVGLGTAKQLEEDLADLGLGDDLTKYVREQWKRMEGHGLYC